MDILISSNDEHESIDERAFLSTTKTTTKSRINFDASDEHSTRRQTNCWPLDQFLFFKQKIVCICVTFNCNKCPNFQTKSMNGLERCRVNSNTRSRRTTSRRITAEATLFFLLLLVEQAIDDGRRLPRDDNADATVRPTFHHERDAQLGKPENLTPEKPIDWRDGKELLALSGGSRPILTPNGR